MIAYSVYVSSEG